jgi:hypothetical protein
MNLLDWLKVEKTKVEYLHGEFYCLQIILENQSIKNIFIKNGEFEKSIFVGRKKRAVPEFIHIPTSSLNNLSRDN